MADAAIQDRQRPATTSVARAAGGVLDRFFAPHGAAAYLRWIGVGDRAPSGRAPTTVGGNRGPGTVGIGSRSAVDAADDVADPVPEGSGRAEGKPRSASSRSVPARPRSASDAPVAHGEVDFRLSGLTAVAEGTLLETAEAAGLAPRNRCRRGICGTCTTPKAAGSVFDVRTGETSGGAGPIRLCVSIAQGDVVVDL